MPGSVRLLLVDPDPGRLEAVCLGLAAVSFPDGHSPSVTTCRRAEEALLHALKALRAGQPYAVAAIAHDLGRGRTGQWAAERLRAADPALERILMGPAATLDGFARAGLHREERLTLQQTTARDYETVTLLRTLALKWLAERQLTQLAHFDPVTQLPNRALFRQRLETRLSAPAPAEFTLLTVGLDPGQPMQGALGAAQAETLWRELSHRLRTVASGARGPRALPAGLGEEPARLGDHQFGLVLPGAWNDGDVRGEAERLLAALVAPLTVGGQTLHAVASVGVAQYPCHGDTAESLLRHAGLALQSALHQGPGGIAFYQSAMTETAQRQLLLETRLRGALARHEFELVYQPQLHLASGSVSGTEALLRWRTAELGAVSPADFIPVAEATGLMRDIGGWVLKTACQQAATWRAEGVPFGRMAVNVSCAQLMGRGFVEEVTACLRALKLPAECLELEITETLLMQDEPHALATFKRLKQLGVSLAIDDFGIGHSTLNRLRHLPVDRLKIDRAFVKELHASDQDRAFVAAILGMAKSLRLEVVAEGIEEFAQLVHLQAAHCEEGQGYLLSKPLDTAGMTQYLRRCAASKVGSATGMVRALHTEPAVATRNDSRPLRPGPTPSLPLAARPARAATRP